METEFISDSDFAAIDDIFKKAESSRYDLQNSSFEKIQDGVIHLRGFLSKEEQTQLLQDIRTYVTVGQKKV
jgi:hypothetical protein